MAHWLKSAASPSVGMLAGTAFGLAMLQGGSTPALAQAKPDGDDEAKLLPTLPVQGDAGAGADDYQVRLPSFDKLTSPLVDTPQTIITVPKQLLDDQGVTTMRDALRNVPGVSLAAGEGGQQGDNLSIRGFNAQNDFYLDGMHDFGSYYRDPFNLQSVEVIEGPASVLFGRGSSGGAVNQVSKQPQLESITAGTVSLGTGNLYRVTTDVNRAVAGVPGAAVRLNMAGDSNGVPGRDDAHYKRFGFAPEVSFGIGTPTRVTLAYYHLQSYDTPDYGIPWLNGTPSPVGHRSFYGYADSDYFRTNVNIVTAKVEHDFSDNLTLTNQFRYGNYKRDLRVTEPLIQNQGIAQGFSTRPVAAVTINRNSIALGSVETLLDDQVYGTLKSGSGFVRNTLLAGLEVSRQTSDPTRYAYAPTATNLLYPDSATPFLQSSSIRSISSVVVNDLAPFAVDTVSLGEHFDVIGGWRYDLYDSTYTQTAPTTINARRNDKLPSWQAALVYKPVPNASVYFHYGTSFNPSAEALTLSVATASVAPESTSTYEVGGKWDVLDARLSLTGSVYELEKANAREVNPVDPTTDILAGDYRVRGFQVGATGRLTPRWQVFGGYSYNDAIVVSSPNKLEVGHAPANAPKHTFSVFTTYKVPMPAPLNDLEIGGGANYVSKRAASSTPVTGTRVIEMAPGYVTAQLFAKYPINKKISGQLNLTNVTNQYYYDQLHPGHIILGASQAALFTLAVKL